jgi:hypothetical protein
MGLEMTTVAAERTWSTADACAVLGISYRRLYMWIDRLGHTGGSGRPVQVDATTLATLAAWEVLAADGIPPGARRRRPAAVAVALTDGPAPYVVVLDDDHAVAFHDGPAAIVCAANAPGPMARQLIDISYLWEIW